ncbi:hypothetical protein LCGC14_3031150, partial [marine sediment metagenome]
EILKDYDSQYWQKILNFTGSFFEVNVPKVEELGRKPQDKVDKKDILQDFSDEYEVIVSTNKNIGKEFIQCLHEYRSKKVNSSHLKLEDLFDPLRLYNYLRNKHWKEGIPETFLKEWRSMNRSQYTLTESDYDDFKVISNSLQIDIEDLNSPQITPHQKIDSHSKSKGDELELLQENKFTLIPSVRTDWSNFKQWMLDKIIVLEKILGIKDVSTYDVIGTDFSLEQFTERLELKLEHVFFELELLQENKFTLIPSVKTDWSNFRQWMLDKIIVLEKILGIKDVSTYDVIGTDFSLEQFTERLELKFEHIFFEKWIGLYKIDDRFRFLLQFVTTIEILHDRLYGKDKKKGLPIKIKKLKF